jgi:hypothetical protein
MKKIVAECNLFYPRASKGQTQKPQKQNRMHPEILALFIPILSVVGLFTSIALHIYFKYKARITVARHAKGESLDAWIKAEAMARASVSRSASLRTGGFLIGAGIGAGLGIFIGGTSKMWAFFASLCQFDYTWEIQDITQYSVYVFFIMACAMFLGGVGMVTAYFLDRGLEKNQ